MKFSIWLLCPLLIFSFISSAQDCVPFTADKNGRVQVNMASDEDCFTVKYRGRDLVASNTMYATFYFNNGAHNLKITMSDGTEVSKKVIVTPDHAVLNYNIKKKKKGKYAVKLSLFDSQLTAQAQQDLNTQVQDNHRKNQEELKARQEASDKEWDEKMAQKEKEREERKAKEKAEQEQLEAERDAQWEADQKEAFSKKHEGKGVAGSGESNTSVHSGGSGPSVEFVLHYEGKPVCDWNIEIAHADEDAELVVASGKTNSQGSFKSSYDGLLEVPFKVTGKRQGGNGEVKWSVDGFWYLNEAEIKAGKIVMDIKKFEDYLSDGGMGGMGGMLSSAVSYSSYGLTSHCD